jgi:multidrug efflux system outer membrane protein
MKLSVRFPKPKHARHALARAIACSMLLVLPSCGIPPLRPAKPGPDLPPSFPAGFPGANGTENSSLLGIDEFFDDPLLTRLIERALAGNQELRILNEEVQIARNEILARQGAYLPFVGYQGFTGVDKPSFFTPPGAAEKDLEYLPGKHFPDPLPDFLMGLNLFWQLDIWRQLRNARDAAAQRYLSAIDRRNYFVTRLVAEIADNYYGLLALDSRLENLDQIIKLNEETLEIARALWRAGRITELGVQRFQAEVRKNQSQKLIVKQDVVQVENRINFLAGRFPQPVERSFRSVGAFIDLNVHALSVGLPPQLLLNRPDIRQAERELAAAGLDVKVARANFFPRLNISGGVGYEAFSPKYLFWTPDALLYNVAGNLVGPLINKKAIQADYKNANARQLESVYNYQRVILNAFTEVVNRVNKVENYRRSIEIKKQQLQALEFSIDLTRPLFQTVRLPYIDVLFVQRDLWDARREAIDTKQEQLSAVVNAYQALGGGLLPYYKSETTGDCGPPMPQPGPNPDKSEAGGNDGGAGEQLPGPRKLPGADNSPEQLPEPNKLQPSVFAPPP